MKKNNFHNSNKRMKKIIIYPLLFIPVFVQFKKKTKRNKDFLVLIFSRILINRNELTELPKCVCVFQHGNNN